MTSTRELVREIKGLLAKGQEEANGGRVADLAEELAEVGQRVRQKLSRCWDLWDEGRHEEARQVARQGHDLREELELLTFPEADTWRAWCEDRELNTVHPLDGSIVEKIYGKPDPLEKLLNRHRRLSLGQAPIPDRLRVMRKIAAARPDQTFWKDDIGALESRRFEELAHTGTVAAKAGQLHTLEAILAELKRDDWLTPPAKALIKSVKAAALPLRKAHAGGELKQLAEKLRDAHGALDEVECRALFKTWDDVVERTKCQPGQVLKDEIEPARAWLRDLDEVRQAETDYETACAALEMGIDDEVDQVTLERLLGKVLRHERGMPPVLSARANTRLEELRRQGRRRFTLILSAILGAAVILGGVVTAGSMYLMHRRSVGRWHDQVLVLLNKPDVPAAGKLLEQVREQEPGVFDSPELQALNKRYTVAAGEIAARRAEFDKTVAAIGSAGVTAQGFDQLLAKATKLAETFAQKEVVEDWRQKRLLARDAVRKKRQAEWRVKLKTLEGLFAKLRESFQLRAPDLTKRAEAVQSLAKTIGAGAEGVTRERARAIAKATTSMLDQAEADTSRGKAVEAALAQIADLGYDAKALAKALRGFAKKYPGHALSSQFLRAVNMSSDWQAAQDWSRLAAGWYGSIRVKGRVAAYNRRRYVAKYLKDHRTGPHQKPAQRVLTYLTVAQDAWTSRGLKGGSTVSRVLANRLIASSYVLTDEDGRTFYLLRRRVKRTRSEDGSKVEVVFSYVTSPSLRTRKKTITFTGDAPKPKRSPQSRFAARASELIREASSRGWETVYLRVAELARKQKQMDPILKAILVRLFLNYAVETTPFEQVRVQALGRELAALNLTASWMLPEDARARTQRRLASAALKRMKPIPPIVKQVEAQLEPVETYQPVAVYLPGRAFKLSLQVKNASLHILSPSAAGGSAFFPVGKVVWRKATLNPDAVRGIPGGTMVFSKRTR